MIEAFHPIENYWYIACFSRELKSKPLSRMILGKPLVLFRTGEKPACLEDRCPHRNIALSLGRVKKDGLQCSYHGWTFGADGKCLRIPAECESNARPAARSLPAVESQGFIWVFLGDKVPGPVPDFPMFSAPRWQHWFMEREFDGSAFQCIENFLDVPHTVFVHSGLFRTREGSDTTLSIVRNNQSVTAEFLNERQVDGLVGKLLVPAGSQVKHTDSFLMPSTTRVDYYFSEKRHFIVMSQCTPVDEYRTRVYTYMAFRFDPIAPIVRLFYAPLSSMILNQDVRVIKKQSDNIKRFGREAFYFHQTDAIAREIREMMSGQKARSSHKKRIKA